MTDRVSMGSFSRDELIALKKAVREQLRHNLVGAAEYLTLLSMYDRIDKTLDVNFPDVVI